MTEHLGVRLARLRGERGLTQEQLAETAEVSVDVIRKLEQRRKDGAWTSTLQRLAAALDVPLEKLVGTQAPPVAVKRPAPSRSGVASSAAQDLVRTLVRVTSEDAARSGDRDATDRTPALFGNPTRNLTAAPELAEVHELRSDQPTIEDVAILEDTASAFRTWDHRHGGRLHRRAAVGQLAQLASLLAVPQPRIVAQRLFSVASRLALVVAQMSADTGMPHQARTYRLFAIEAAKVSTDPIRLARAVNAEARAALGTDPLAALHLLSKARSVVGTDVGGDTLSLLATTEAWAHARMRNAPEMAGALDRGRHELDVVAHGPDPVFGLAELEGVAGACYEFLAASGVEGRASVERAEVHIRAALSLRADFYARSRVFDLAGLTHVYLLRNDPEQATVVGRVAVDAGARLASARVRRRLHRTAVRSLSLYPDVPEIRQFTEVVRTRVGTPSR